jgi:predicted DNA-binding ribbon-helix-helix protein
MAKRPGTEPTTRTSITLPKGIYMSLECIAKQKKVSVAWVMRDAAESYVSQQWPLFAAKSATE